MLFRSELLHAHDDGFVDERFYITELHARDTAIAGVRTFQTEGAGQVAGGAGVDPQLFQFVAIDVTPGITLAGVSPAVECPGFQHFHGRNAFTAGRSGFSQGHRCSSMLWCFCHHGANREAFPTISKCLQAHGPASIHPPRIWRTRSRWGTGEWCPESCSAPGHASSPV